MASYMVLQFGLASFWYVARLNRDRLALVMVSLLLMPSSCFISSVLYPLRHRISIEFKIFCVIINFIK